MWVVYSYHIYLKNQVLVQPEIKEEKKLFLNSDEVDKKIDNLVDLFDKREKIDQIIENIEHEETNKQIDHTIDLIAELISTETTNEQQDTNEIKPTIISSEEKIDTTLDLIAEAIVNESNKQDLLESKSTITNNIIDNTIDLIVDLVEKKK